MLTYSIRIDMIKCPKPGAPTTQGPTRWQMPEKYPGGGHVWNWLWYNYNLKGDKSTLAFIPAKKGLGTVLGILHGFKGDVVYLADTLHDIYLK